MRYLPVFLLLTAIGFSAAAVGTRTIDVTIQNRTVTSPGQVIRVSEGDQIVLRFSSDEAVELHLHGYDIELDVEPGTPAEMKFEATASGRFPVTSHGFAGQHDEHGHGTLLYIEVYPE
jgi:FtsP/CotA-like multicopper oxidase with cupredoxin domain